MTALTGSRFLLLRVAAAAAAVMGVVSAGRQIARTPELLRQIHRRAGEWRSLRETAGYTPRVLSAQADSAEAIKPLEFIRLRNRDWTIHAREEQPEALGGGVLMRKLRLTVEQASASALFAILTDWVRHDTPWRLLEIEWKALDPETDTVHANIVFARLAPAANQ